MTPDTLKAKTLNFCQIAISTVIYLIAIARKQKNPYGKKNFPYNPERDEYRCPMGQTVAFAGEHNDCQKKEW